MPSGGVFHRVAAAVSINRLPSFTVLLRLVGLLTMLYLPILDAQWDGTNLTVHIDIQVHHYEEF